MVRPLWITSPKPGRTAVLVAGLSVSGAWAGLTGSRVRAVLPPPRVELWVRAWTYALYWCPLRLVSRVIFRTSSLLKNPVFLVLGSEFLVIAAL